MNDTKLSRIIELMVQREVKRIIPELKKQIISEINRNSNKPLINNKLKVSNNSLLNELINSAGQFSESLNVSDRVTMEADEFVDVGFTMPQGNGESHVPVHTQASKDTINLFMKDYSKLIDKMEK